MDVENRLRISGHAESKVVPDRARCTVTVRAENDRQEIARPRTANASLGTGSRERC
jgi:uncharacterized protein YggE